MMESSKNVRIWSLPGGDRRGAPGADAGRYSMQTIGGEGNGRPSAGEPEQSESNRRYNLRPRKSSSRSTSRAGVGGLSSKSAADVGAIQLASIEERSPDRTERADDNQEAQSSTSSPMSLFSSIPSSPHSYLHSIPISSPSNSSSPSLNSSISLAEDVVQATIVNKPVPTKAITRTRKKWTEEMNTFILRTYFIITKLETETRSYLTELHSRFVDQFPDIDVSKQRIGDQRRAIIRSKLLPTSRVTEIRAEVESYLLTNQHQIQTSLTQTQRTQRMQWTAEHNETIIREYYRITHLEVNKTAYRKLLHQHFINTFPQLAHISEQRIADQRRVIITNKLIDDARLNEIKLEIEAQLNASTSTNAHLNTNQQTPQDLNATVWYNAIDASHVIIENNGVEFSQPEMHFDVALDQDRNQEIDNMFDEALQYFSDTNPEERPFIPKQKATKKLASSVSYLNEVILPENVNIDTSFKTLQTIIYCVAWTAAKCNGSKLKIPPEVRNPILRNSVPNWQKRLEKKVDDLRKKIGRLTQYINGNRSRTLTKQVDKILEQHRTHTIHEEPNTDPVHYLDTLKQKLTVVSSRLRRYKSCTTRKMQNNQFCNNERKFYQNLSQTTTNRLSSTITAPTRTNTSILDPTELRQFWAHIWENPADFRDETEWIQKENAKYSDLTPMEYENIPIDVYQNVLKSAHNWKTPGSDHLHSYWYKKLTHIHPFLYNHINDFIKNPDTIPNFITAGTTYMISKDTNDTANPAKYRPITCLQTIYKIITACLSRLIYSHVVTNNILAEQQKGCRKFSQGCKEQLIIDSVVLQHTQKTKRDLYSIYIDYKKAYDSVPHTWLIKILEIYKIHPQLIAFLGSSMNTWTTQLQAHTPDSRLIETTPIRVRRGIFQGDALSPLWFCLALNPLSNILNSAKIGYFLEDNTDRQTNHPESSLNHLLYMDDIKIYASSENELNLLIDFTDKFSQDIAMDFGIDKCKINSTRAGQSYQHRYQMQSGETIDPLNENEAYKYLGYHQSKYIHYKEIKAKLKQNFKHRLNSIFKSQLNSKHTTKAINSYAIPVLTYSFGIINWTKTELLSLQRLINVTMTRHRKHHPRACIQRQVLPRVDGGRGIINILNLHNRQITTLRTYFHSKADTSILHKLVAELDRKHTPLNLQDRSKQSNEELTEKSSLISEWTLKSLHGRHRHDLSQPTVDMQASNEWLHRGELFPETEGFMIAIQDQVVETRNYQKHIIKTRNLPSEMCRRCSSSSETIQHITGACKMIAQTDYKFRHDQVANIIHQRLATKYDLIQTPTRPTPYYKYSPETVLENSTHKLYFDRAILTDKTTHYNRPDLTLVNKISKTAFLIDIAIPNTHNLQTTIAEKLSKYIDLKNEITRMWRLEKVSIIPIVLSSTGVIPKQLFASLDLLDLPKHTFVLLQKAVILNTCRIVRKFLQTDLATDVPTSTSSARQQTTGHNDVHLA